jgi:pilus assembly protein CpaE
MLRAMIASSDAPSAEQLTAALAETGRAAVVRTLNRYPAEPELMRVLRAHAPQLFFIDVAPVEEALALISTLTACAPNAQILAFDRRSDQRTLLALMRHGVREFIAVPDGFADLSGALDRAAAALERAPDIVQETDELIAFLPAKPGVGCSTAALNTAAALAAGKGARVLLIDLDLNCGILGFLLRVSSNHSVVEAAEHAAHLDEELWPKLVARTASLDLLPAGAMRPGFRIELPALRYLIDFARRHYDFICVDLSGLMERYSVELMQEAKRVFLVTTPELPSLHLAQQKLEYLRTLEMESRISLLLNRAQKRALVSAEEVEKTIGLPVALAIPNDYRGVHTALAEARPVAGDSELGRCFTELARRIVSKNAPAKPARRFVEYFSLVPARYSFADTPK